jgi:hypothetical protein
MRVMGPMTDRQGNPIKLYLDEQEAYWLALSVHELKFPEGLELALSNTLLAALERLGRLRQSLEVG